MKIFPLFGTAISFDFTKGGNIDKKKDARMSREQKDSSYNNWSIEKGDYVRKGLSEEHKRYSSRFSGTSIALIAILFILIIVLAGILFAKHGTHV